jgi:hypothetical protein
MRNRICLWSVQYVGDFYQYVKWAVEADGIYIGNTGIYITGHDMSVNMDGREVKATGSGLEIELSDGARNH